jgi:hypothetical protein
MNASRSKSFGKPFNAALYCRNFSSHAFSYLRIIAKITGSVLAACLLGTA